MVGTALEDVDVAEEEDAGVTTLETELVVDESDEAVLWETTVVDLEVVNVELVDVCDDVPTEEEEPESPGMESEPRMYFVRS